MVAQYPPPPALLNGSPEPTLARHAAREANALGRARRWRASSRFRQPDRFGGHLVPQNCVFDVRGWRNAATLAGFIVSAPFLSAVPPSGQSMPHDLAGMERYRPSTSPATQRPSPPAANGTRASPD